MPQDPHSVDWKLSQFQALADEAHPQATLVTHSFSVYAEPAALGRLTNSGGSTLAEASTTDSSDVVFDAPYGNPFQGWGASISGATLYSFSVTLPGFPQPKSISGTVVNWSTKDTWSSLSIAPVVGPAKDVALNGMPVTDVLTSVGMSPTLTWSAPDLGTPSFYRVTVRQLRPSGSALTVATLYTEGTQVRIPPGVLQTGEYYYVRIAGQVNQEVTKPFHLALESGYTDALTSAFTP